MEEYMENLFEYQTGLSEDLEPEVLEFMKENTARYLSLPENATVEEIDEAMKKKYHVT